MAAGRLGYGVGFNLRWASDDVGFSPATGRLSDRLATFLAKGQYGYLMFSYQPKGCSGLDIDTYLAAYRRLRAAVPAEIPLALHQTTLNFGLTEGYDRSAVYAFTNEVHRELGGLEWVNEDIGIWSHHGLPMPYPLPPLLIRESIQPTVDCLVEARESLRPRLHLEFPGFADLYSVVAGHMDAFDWFREVVEGADVPATFDIGHILSYRWILGHRGEALFEGIERLPLSHCEEIHLSGCEVRNGAFLDLHHGILMDEQVDLLDRLIDLCPNLVGVTYEDPALDGRGQFPDRATPNVDRLQRRVSQWMA